MAVFRVERTRDYTVMCNHHLKDSNLSLKAKGLLSMMLSLPDEWNYTTRGLAAICKEGVDAIGKTLKELELAGYIIRRQLRGKDGRISDTEYTIFEKPRKPSSPDTTLPDTENPYLDNPDTEAPDTDNPAQLNTKKSNTQKSNTDRSSTHSFFLPAADRMTDGFEKKAEIREQIEYDILCQQYDRMQLDELVEIMLEVAMNRSPTVKIGRDAEYPTGFVQQRFEKITSIGIFPVSAFASGGDYPDNALPTAESSAADAQETKQIGTVTTNGGNLNVRTGAGLDNTAFTQLPNGTVVDVIGRDGDWVKILLPARAGYVYGSYLTVTDAADSTVSIGGITLPFDEKELADLWQLLLGSMTGGSDALTPDGNLTLIDDIGSSTKAGKQFITLESKNGNVFYMIIDRDDEGEETVHFLNQVDEADLMALTGEEETPATCSCTTKCVAGTVNTSCPVCAVNMTECVGKEAKPEVPAEPTEPAAEEPEKKSGMGGILVVLLIVSLGGGAAFYIFKQKKTKPQTKGSADLDDYDYGEDEYEFEPYEDEPEQDTTEDTDA